MYSPRTIVVSVLALAMAVIGVPAVAQISNLDFNSLSYNGTAAQATNGGGQQVLRLTQDVGGQDGSAWYITPQSVADGFTTVFQFQITHDFNFGTPADGLAFVIQSAQSFEGGPLSALGGGGGDIGYASIDNSLAVEFDTYFNFPYDPNANHVAVQSCGIYPNTADHTQGCQNESPSNLGITANPGVNLADGNVHTVILQYDPGSLSIFIDNSGTAALTVPVNLANLLSLNEGGGAYVGFTGATGANSETTDVLSWTFTPGQNTQPTMITQDLTPGPGQHFTNYIFGSYNHKYGYNGANAGDTVTVTATPTDPAVLNPNLASFSLGTQCIVYDGTGGKCVIFQVSCAQQTGSDCQNLPYTLFEGYNHEQTITAPCLLKSETYPPGVWTNILTNFSQGRFDPVSSGGSRGFSYFVAAQNCAPVLPASGLTGNNCNGAYTGTFHGNLTVSNGQSCTFTNGGVTGNVTQTGGSLLLQNNSFVNGNVTVTGGNVSISNSTLGHNLTIQGGGSFLIGPAVRIAGNLTMQNLTANTSVDQVCGVTVTGNLTLQSSAAMTDIGASTGCPGNTVNGNMTVQSNTGATEVFTNAVGHNLTCQSNSSITGGGNTAGRKLGQCAAF
jgi:hypothetical protein